MTGNRIYFVAHNAVITDRDLLRSVAEVCGCKSRVLAVPQWALKLASHMVDSIPTWRTTIPSLSVDRAKEIWPDRWVVSSASFEKDFGWTARMPFREALSPPGLVHQERAAQGLAPMHDRRAADHQGEPGAAPERQAFLEGQTAHSQNQNPAAREVRGMNSVTFQPLRYAQR